MERELKQFSCDSVCGFMVQSYNESEIMGIAKTHIKDGHPGVDVPEDKLKNIIKTVNNV